MDSFVLFERNEADGRQGWEELIKNANRSDKQHVEGKDAEQQADRQEYGRETLCLRDKVKKRSREGSRKGEPS